MNNKLYISPFKEFKGHIQVLEHEGLFMVTISNENEYVKISNKEPPEYVNNRDNQWDTSILTPIQTSSPE